MTRFIAATLAAMFICFTAPAIAATSGVVRGTVTFAGKPKAGVTLTLARDDSHVKTTSDAQGAYVFTQVPFGHYTLTTHVEGAADRTIDLDVSSDSIIRLDVALLGLQEIAHTAVTAHAGVGGNAVSVNTLSRSQIATSPVRDSLDRLIETLPGIVRFSYNEPVAHGFHGLTYEVDGAPLPQATSSNFAEIVDPRNIDSLEVFTGAFPAEYGGSRQGAVVNIVTDRLSDGPMGWHGTVGVGGGNDSTAQTSLDETGRFGSSQLTLNLNTDHTGRGLDTPAFNTLHDDASRNDEFLRFVTQLAPRSTLAFNVSNQLAQFQIPINIDPNNVNNPIFSPPTTDDVQREYDRFVSLNLTHASRDGNGVFSVIPWLHYTRTDYDGDLANDVQTLAPNSNTAPGAPALANQIGLKQNRAATYEGIRLSDFRAGAHHAWKIGLDASRENFQATQTFACFAADCNPAPSTPPPAPPAPGYFSINTAQAQAGTQVGLFAEDKWQPIENLVLNYGLRYDHSTGYVGGDQLSPRIGLNVSDGASNIYHIYYGRLYAAPQLEDVRASCVVLNGCSTVPVYDLQPERDAYFELGLAHTFNPRFNGSVNLFQRSVVNVLDTTQFLNTPLFAVFNNATGIDTGVEFRLQDQTRAGNSWFMTTTVSGSYAGGISGSTFLFPPNPNPSIPLSSPALLSPEDHDQTVASTVGYTQLFGNRHAWFGTMQVDYGTGYPVAFQSANLNLSGRLPSHTTLDLSLGRNVQTAQQHNLGLALDVQNVLNHQYVVKIANGFNTTQIAQGRTFVVK